LVEIGCTRLDVTAVLYLHNDESHIFALWELIGKGAYLVQNALDDLLGCTADAGTQQIFKPSLSPRLSTAVFHLCIEIGP
jgi:hypothetical protein